MRRRQTDGSSEGVQSRVPVPGNGHAVGSRQKAGAHGRPCGLALGAGELTRQGARGGIRRDGPGGGVLGGEGRWRAPAPIEGPMARCAAGVPHVGAGVYGEARRGEQASLGARGAARPWCVRARRCNHRVGHARSAVYARTRARGGTGASYSTRTRAKGPGRAGAPAAAHDCGGVL
ncbi:MAG: hypothetical protein J3K34DRAFT_403363 [Monoraphidium minutum]|nr:MAG: hypothetical protein J3K34DRAFT_403363 [Monoraphidium minutum]